MPELRTVLEKDANAKQIFCICWPFAKRVLNIIKDLPGIDPKLKEGIELVLVAGDAAYGGVCKGVLGLGKPDWQIHIDWAIHDDGAWEPQCIQKVLSVYPECVVPYPGTGRACVMRKAIAAAKADNCNHAFEMALLCQCHNADAQKAIGNAGQQAVCDYLKTK
jgi:hypothetical protein